MTRRLRNLTITVRDDAAEWARVQAAQRDMSVSRLVGELIEERMSQLEEYERAMRRALAQKPYLKSKGRYLSREELHERARIR